MTLPESPRHHLPALLLYCLFTLSRTAIAAESESAADPPPVDESTLAREALPASDEEEIIRQAQQDKLRHEQAIAELEARSGQNAYSQELVQAYMDLGMTLRTLGLHQEAIAALDQALQSTRINYGLSSEQQIPILRELKASNEALEDWKAVDNNLHLIHHIATRAYPVGDLRRIRALQLLAQWKIRAVKEELIQTSRNIPGETGALFESEIRKLDNVDDYQGKNIDLAILHLGQAEIEYMMALNTFALPLSNFQTTAQRSTSQVSCRAVRLPDGRVVQICETVEVPNLDYYIDPTNRKNQEIGMHLGNMKDSIVEAYNALQEEQEEEQLQDDRALLLMEVQRLTAEYNNFVNREESRESRDSATRIEKK